MHRRAVILFCVLAGAWQPVAHAAALHYVAWLASAVLPGIEPGATYELRFQARAVDGGQAGAVEPETRPEPLDWGQWPGSAWPSPIVGVLRFCLALFGFVWIWLALALFGT